jgi:pyruvate/2-oxoglutarate dehydrogenase complex dihydrolipoamide dehydrogenase (E3) component
MYDLVVIGGGSGGLHAARAAARVGARIALIDKERQEGQSRFDPCMPSKSLVEVAKLARQIRGAGEYGIEVQPPRLDFAAVMDRVRRVTVATAAANSDEALGALGIEVIRGTASFDAYDTVLVSGRPVVGNRFIIATGSRPSRPEIPGLADTAYLDSATIWSLSQVPESMIILGGGPVAMEFAQVFARFGSRVSVLTDQDRVLPREDPEVSGHVACMLTGEGVTIKRKATLEKVETRDGRKVVVFRDGETGERAEASGAEILCVTGRLAKVEGLNLESVGIHADPAHGIVVDELLQTHAIRVLAIGDVLLGNQYTHSAQREAEVAAENAVLRRRVKMDYSKIPWATFLDPEVATVGISEAQARAEEIEHRVCRASYAENDRARIDGRTEGFVKVVASPSGKILGATVLGKEAGLVLQQFVLAMEARIGLGDLAEATQIYPTYACIVRDLAGRFRANRLERGFHASALRFFYGFQPRSTRGGHEAPRGEQGIDAAH